MLFSRCPLLKYAQNTCSINLFFHISSGNQTLKLLFLKNIPRAGISFPEKMFMDQFEVVSHCFRTKDEFCRDPPLGSRGTKQKILFSKIFYLKNPGSTPYKSLYFIHYSLPFRKRREQKSTIFNASQVLYHLCRRKKRYINIIDQKAKLK